MSINLHCNGIELWQTPTNITGMCMAGYESKKEVHKGKRAVRALRIYIEYVRGTLNGSWPSYEEFQNAEKAVLSHIKDVEDYISSTDKNNIEVYSL